MDPKPFVLAVKSIMFDDCGRTLVIRRSAMNEHFAGTWEWPGGKVDRGEEYATAVLREAKEETGLDVAITGLAGAFHFEMPRVNVVQLCLETEILGGTLTLSDEHDQSAWVALEDLATLEIVDHPRAFMLEYAEKRIRE